jgi:hypothetical protein
MITDQESFEVTSPCLDHWVMLCLMVAEAAGWTPPPEDTAGEDTTDAAGVTELPARPSPMTERVVSRGRAAARKRERAESAAMHAHLREQDAANDKGAGE